MKSFVGLTVTWLALATTLVGHAGGGSTLMKRDPNAMTDRMRPQYHFLPASNWMNDPNGLIQFNGVYHIFYQRNPFAATWGPMYWGHAESHDLVHWRLMPDALKPDSPADKGGVWTGCMVDDKGAPTAIYTGVEPQCVCIATGNRDLSRFTKYVGNPVVPAQQQAMGLTGFRDPYVWKQGSWWMMVVGAGIPGKGGELLLYRSRDLRQWESRGTAFVGDRDQHPDMWECPNLFRLGTKWVLIISNGQTWWYTGTFRNGRFSPEKTGLLDAGNSLYAPQTFKDARGRRILFGWLRENRSDAEAHGWQGVMSLPRILKVDANGDLTQAPAPELQRLRARSTHATAIKLTQREGFLPLKDFEKLGDECELQAVLKPGQAGRVGLVVAATPDGVEQTRIEYNVRRGGIDVDRSRSSLSKSADAGTVFLPAELDSAGEIRLRIFVDRSVIEIYTADGQCMAVRIYPTRPDAMAMGVTGDPGGAIEALRVNRMRSAIPSVGAAEIEPTQE
ncbi:MAG: glycoside hydrolase family 32 protein [Armatimonadetes bacterium]|nr:glycoside hydrolase family 32 protein [Armatimonadota bacterium]MDE2207676.1 glycoside hydrolase family 32 protein [Armatimonadota bacterium]